MRKKSTLPKVENPAEVKKFQQYAIKGEITKLSEKFKAAKVARLKEGVNERAVAKIEERIVAKFEKLFADSKPIVEDK